VIRRGIDLNRFKPAPTAGVRRVDNIFRILCVGTLEIKKGQRYLIDAVARLINEGRRVKCSFVGDGPIGDILRRHVKKLGLTDCIIFLGSRTQQEVLEYLQSSDVFVLPSIIGPGNRMEGIPNALMEAMACELPVVATNLSGTPELVRDGENGLLVSPRDDRALALAIARLQDSPGLARSFGGAGRITVQIDFNQEINIAALLELYRRAIASLGLKVQCQ
jgi:glycosyltransferase involved in cell wall biosynthesis